MIHLDLDDLLHVAARTLGVEPEVRDHGLLESALARPPAAALGGDVYPIPDKAAALLHSLARNHAVVEGNRRLALGATIALLGLNGFRLTFTSDEAHNLVIAVATVELEEVSATAATLEANSEPR